MNSIIEQMLAQHGSATLQDRKNGIKEVVQEIVLCGLSRAGFLALHGKLWDAHLLSRNHAARQEPRSPSLPCFSRRSRAKR